MRRLSQSSRAIAVVAFLICGTFIVGFSNAGIPSPDAKDTYLDKCSVCHGADGAGKTAKGRKLKAKDLRLPEIQKKSDAELYKVIAKGKGKDMDGYEKELGKEKVQELVTYTRELAKQK